MSKKRDSAAQRLKRLIAEEKQRRRALVVLDNPLFKGAGMLGADPLWNRARELNTALRITDSETALKKAFEAFGLDPDIPENWHRLVCYLADSHFGLKRAGSPIQWTRDKQVQLLADIRETAKRYPKAKLPEIRRNMIKDQQLGGRYKNMSADSLRKRISETIEWANNPAKKPRTKKKTRT